MEGYVQVLDCNAPVLGDSTEDKGTLIATKYGIPQAQYDGVRNQTVFGLVRALDCMRYRFYGNINW